MSLRWSAENERGFTLIELVSVLLFLGILAAVVMPAFNTGGISVETAANAIEADLRMAQELAMSRETSASVGITFTNGSNTYTLTDPAGAFSVTRTFTGAVTISSGGTISFNRFGEPAVISSVQITAGGQTKTITVEQFTGRVILS
jgi:prepilin-type N-terminal cleavage/methylation domain-containing protein